MIMLIVQQLPKEGRTGLRLQENKTCVVPGNFTADASWRRSIGIRRNRFRSGAFGRCEMPIAIFVSSNFPTQREIDPGADWIEHKRLGKAAVARKISVSTGSSSANRGFCCALNILHFHAEMVNSFSAIARRQNGEIDMAIGNVDRLAMLARFATAGNFLESERGFVEF